MLTKWYKQKALRNFADRRTPEETRELVELYLDQPNKKETEVEEVADYFKISECVCPLGNPPHWVDDYFRKEHLTEEQTKRLRELL